MIQLTRSSLLGMEDRIIEAPQMNLWRQPQVGGAASLTVLSSVVSKIGRSSKQCVRDRSGDSTAHLETTLELALY